MMCRPGYEFALPLIVRAALHISRRGRTGKDRRPDLMIQSIRPRTYDIIIMTTLLRIYGLALSLGTRSTVHPRTFMRILVAIPMKLGLRMSDFLFLLF